MYTIRPSQAVDTKQLLMRVLVEPPTHQLAERYLLYTYDISIVEFTSVVRRSSVY